MTQVSQPRDSSARDDRFRSLFSTVAGALVLRVRVLQSPQFAITAFVATAVQLAGGDVAAVGGRRSVAQVSLAAASFECSRRSIPHFRRDVTFPGADSVVDDTVYNGELPKPA